MSRYARGQRNLTPKQSVQLANEVAYKYSADAAIRAVATRIVGDTPMAYRYPAVIALWIRDNVKYVQEAAGIEVIQYPYLTLPAMTVGPFEITGIGLGDCDDLSTLFACLVRSLGINAFVAGIGKAATPDSFFHAMGLCHGILYELSLDRAYGGDGNDMLTRTLQPDETGLMYDPVSHRFNRLRPG